MHSCYKKVVLDILCHVHVSFRHFSELRMSPFSKIVRDKRCIVNKYVLSLVRPSALDNQHGARRSKKRLCRIDRQLGAKPCGRRCGR